MIWHSRALPVILGSLFCLAIIVAFFLVVAPKTDLVPSTLPRSTPHSTPTPPNKPGVNVAPGSPTPTAAPTPVDPPLAHEQALGFCSDYFQGSTRTTFHMTADLAKTWAQQPPTPGFQPPCQATPEGVDPQSGQVGYFLVAPIAGQSPRSLEVWLQPQSGGGYLVAQVHV